MPEHDDLRNEIPDYLTSRLEAEALSRLERHLAECRECSLLIDSARMIAEAIRSDGEIMFEPHPDPLLLRRHALGARVEEGGNLDRHLEACPSCALEAAYWKAGLHTGLTDDARRPAPPVAAAASSRHRWLALAAGLLLGVGIVFLWRPSRVAPARPTPAPAPPAAPGAVPILLLAGPLRGGSPTTTITLPAEAPFLVLAVQPSFAISDRDADQYRFEVTGAGGAKLWSAQLDSAEARRLLEASEVLTFLLPGSLLSPGSYALRVFDQQESPHDPVMEIPFVILPFRPDSG